MALRKKDVGRIPSGPGVYLLKDATGTVVYVGKAKALRSRLKSYIDPEKEPNPRRRLLVEVVVSVEHLSTDSEVEALVLENVLIKEHRPRYNVEFRDDKTYPYLKLTVHERFPRLLKTRRVVQDGSLYFGPYVSAVTVNRLLRFIARHFGVGSCGGERVKTGKPCFNYHIGRCLGACGGMIGSDPYREQVNRVKTMLEGNFELAIAAAEQEMWAAASRNDFERAARLRDLMNGLKRMSQEQKAERLKARDGDAVGLALALDCVCVQVFQVRDGKITGRRAFYGEVPADEDSPAELIRSFLFQHYCQGNDGENVPGLIMLQQEPSEQAETRLHLEKIRGGKIKLWVPKRGDASRLVKLAVRNARELGQIKTREKAVSDHAGKDLQRWEAFLKRYSLSWQPELVECYDVSNIQGMQTVASRVVFKDGAPSKKLYRRYRLRPTGQPDDVGSIKETLARRVSHLLNGSEEEPSLIVVDGGTPQVNTARAVLDEKGLEHIPVLGLAKREESIHLPGARFAIRLADGNIWLHLLTHLRNEAHRFAISYHRKLRSRAGKRSFLDDIEGIGPARRKKLLTHFRDVSGIAAAGVDDVSRLLKCGRQVAQRVVSAAIARQAIYR